MSNYLVETEISLGIVTCSECGTIFGVTANYQKQKQKDHSIFYCPNGHSQYYPQKSEEEKLRERLKETENSLSTTQFELMIADKRIKTFEKRAKNGVCPCCNRQFIQLARHMRTKHPDYDK